MKRLKGRKALRARRGQARGVATRAKLLHAAKELFSHHGYAAVSRADVARRAGYGMSSIYHHFPEKRDLLLELIDEWGKAMPVQRRAAFDVRTALAGRPRRAAREFLRKSYEQLEHGPSFYRVIVTEAERDPEVRRRYEAAHRGITTWIGELTRLGQQISLVRPDRDPDAAGFVLHVVMESTLTELLAQRPSDRFRDQVLDELTELVCSYVVGASHDAGGKARN